MSEQGVRSNAAQADASTHSPALAAFYADKSRMWRNVGWTTFGHFGTAVSLTILEPMMNLRLKAVGLSESTIGLLTSANLWAVSFLVMYFSWKSDHCLSRLGRRTPYVLLALPFVIGAVVLFPLFTTPWVLIALMVVYYYFNDMKASTYPLLQIDCVSRDVLARVSGLAAIMIGLAGFLAARYGSRLADVDPRQLFFFCAAAIAGTTLIALWQIKEPPIKNPASGSFSFMAPVRIACRDRRVVLLMVAIALLNCFSAIFTTWVWFYAKGKLNLTLSATGAAMSWGLLLKMGISYPAGWLIDRFGSYLALCLEWVFMLVIVLLLSFITGEPGLIVLMVLFYMFQVLQVSGDTLLWKMMDKADTGSYTSTVALIRNFTTGTAIFISGYLIRWTGGYRAAFYLGFILGTLAMIFFLLYRRAMARKNREDSPADGGISEISDLNQIAPTQTSANIGAMQPAAGEA